MIRPFFPMLFLIAQQRSFWGILFGGWSEIKLVAQKAQVEMPQTSQVMGFNTEYGPKLCEGRMWALWAEGKSNIKCVKIGDFSHTLHMGNLNGVDHRVDTGIQKNNWIDGIHRSIVGCPIYPIFRQGHMRSWKKKGAIAMAHMRHSFANA